MGFPFLRPFANEGDTLVRVLITMTPYQLFLKAEKVAVVLRALLAGAKPCGWCPRMTFEWTFIGSKITCPACDDKLNSYD